LFGGETPVAKSNEKGQIATKTKVIQGEAMADEEKTFIRTGNVSGTGIVFGSHNQTTVTVQSGTEKEILSLVEELRAQIEQAALPEGAKSVLLSRVVPSMQEAAKSPEPAPALKASIERVNDVLVGAGTTAGNVQGIVASVARIAGLVGLGIKTVAPFVASLL
jgi:hypothetical protein